MASDSCRARWVERGAKPAPPPVRMSDAWTYHACPPRFVHTSGWYFPLHEDAIRGGMLVEHARARFGEEMASDLDGFVKRWARKYAAALARGLWGEEKATPRGVVDSGSDARVET